MGHHHDRGGEGEHQEAQDLDEDIHRTHGRGTRQKRQGENGGDRGPGTQGNPEDGETQRAAGQIADIEHKAAEHHQHPQQAAQEGVDGRGDGGAGEARHADDSPHVPLHTDVDQHRGEDGEGHVRSVDARENRGLGEEARADRRRGHQEGRRGERPASGGGEGRLHSRGQRILGPA